MKPTSGLDPGTEFEMMKLLRKLADQGRTIVLITHATKNVMMCDKVIFLAAAATWPTTARPKTSALRRPRW
jgi:ABC-type multidrug transport system ATPase subunit